jgi:hypothetical protein
MSLLKTAFDHGELLPYSPTSWPFLFSSLTDDIYHSVPQNVTSFVFWPGNFITLFQIQWWEQGKNFTGFPNRSPQRGGKFAEGHITFTTFLSKISN